MLRVSVGLRGNNGKQHFRRGYSENEGGRLTDRVNPIGIGRQVRPVHWANRRTFINNRILDDQTDEYKLKLRQKEHSLAENLEIYNNVNVDKLITDKSTLAIKWKLDGAHDKYYSIDRLRMKNPYSNKGLDHLYTNKEGRGVSVVSAVNDTRRTKILHVDAFKNLSIGHIKQSADPSKPTDLTYQDQGDNIHDIFQGPAEELQGNLLPFDIRFGTSIQTGHSEQPTKHANIEMNKHSHFLNLTPVAIKNHAKELKTFLTEFPKELKTCLKTEQPKMEQLYKDRAFGLPKTTLKDDGQSGLVVGGKNANKNFRNKNTKEKSLTLNQNPEKVRLSAEFPLILKTTDYISSRAIMADPRAHRAEIRVSINNFQLSDRQRMKMIDLIQSHENEATRGYQPRHNRVTRTPGLSGEVVARYDPISQVIHFQSQYLPLRSQNINYLYATLWRLIQETVSVRAYEKDLVYNHLDGSILSQKEIDERLKEKRERYRKWNIEGDMDQSYTFSKLNSDTIGDRSKLEQNEIMREKYVEYTKQMMKSFKIDKKFYPTMSPDKYRKTFNKNDPAFLRYGEINKQMLGPSGDHYHALDGNKHLSKNIGNI